MMYIDALMRGTQGCGESGLLLGWQRGCTLRASRPPTDSEQVYVCEWVWTFRVTQAVK